MKEYKEGAPLAGAQPLPQAPAVHGKESAVVVPLLQNLAGGFAVDLLVSTIGTVVATGGTGEPPGPQFVQWFSGAGLVLGLLTFAVFTIIRAFRDEIGILVAAWARGRANQVNSQTAQELAAARQRIAELEKALREQGGEQAAHEGEVQSDAYRLLAMLNAGEGVSREKARDVGIGQRRWERARQMLANSGALDAKGNFKNGAYGDAVQALTAYLVTSRRQQLAANGKWYRT